MSILESSLLDQRIWSLIWPVWKALLIFEQFHRFLGQFQRQDGLRRYLLLRVRLEFFFNLVILCCGFTPLFLKDSDMELNSVVLSLKLIMFCLFYPKAPQRGGLCFRPSFVGSDFG